MPLDFDLDYDRGIPVYRQIYEAVLNALASGALQPTEQLPTIHVLARRLRINPNTVARAYRDLETDGHIVGHRGKGTFPVPQRVAPPGKERILRTIFERAVAEGARHNLSPDEIIRYFEKVKS